ncbi:MAG: transporter related [Clostridia bacterium]|nr:transporter related [Clostridia bacterium]
MASILYTKALSKVYGKSDNQVSALDNVNIDFEEGSFTAITGRSGSGKSTLLHLLGGLDEPTKGAVYLENKRIYDLRDSERTILRRRRIGFVFQFYNLMPELTAYENIVLPINLDGRNPDKIYLNEIIDILGLSDRLKHYAGELSGGQQQRVAIARALATKPAVVLADEPTGNLDGKSGAEVLELLCLTKKRFNQTLIMVTHDLKIAEGADRVITLADGKIEA